MQSFYQTLILCLCLATSTANAGEVRAILERAGFMGTVAAGGSYEWTEQHASDLSLGTFLIGSEQFYQANIGYRYSRWNSPMKGDMWRPLQFGFFGVYALNNKRFFLKSPDKYPYPGYYDETAFRYGLEFGTTYTFMPSRIAIGYRLRIFDNGIIATFNNNNRDIQYYISSGFTVQYLF